MNDTTDWTPSPEDNKLGLSDKNLINEFEAKGIAIAELSIFDLDIESEISVQLILEIHRIAFSELYKWAGKWRTTNVSVGNLIPPEPARIIQLIYQFVDTLNYKLANAKTIEEHIDCLAYAHYEFIRIHPFNNGNGRTGRMLMNLIALKFGYKPLELYHREGEGRKIYINALREADKGNSAPLINLIRKELIPF